MSSVPPWSFRMTWRMNGPDTQPLPNIPIIHRPGMMPGEPLQRTPLTERKRLMVVDDEPSIVKLIARVLATDGYNIVCAESGEAAAALVERPDFAGVDLLVTDLMMPGVNGRELAAIVRARYPDARVLYVTGFADTLFKGLQELADGESFIEKPFGTDGLLEATRLLMFGHISDAEPPTDTHDEAAQWTDERLRTRLLRILRKLKMA